MGGARTQIATCGRGLEDLLPSIRFHRQDLGCSRTGKEVSQALSNRGGVVGLSGHSVASLCLWGRTNEKQGEKSLESPTGELMVHRDGRKMGVKFVTPWKPK